MIPYSRQFIDNKDMKSVLNVMKSDLITQGPIVKKFEKKLSNYCNAKFAVAVSSATAALHLSCMSLGLKKGDYLWTSPISFVASANCGVYCGAEIDFVDINELTFNIDTSKLEQKLKFAKKKNKLPKIIIPVHLGGLSSNMKEIFRLSKIYKFKIIEDASHALGSKIGNFKVGSCKYSDLTVFSFHPVKIITTGEGGAILSNKKKLFKKLNLMRTSGVNKEINKNKLKKIGYWYYEQICNGYNYRMNEMSAALGYSQLKKINSFIKERNLISRKYLIKLSNENIIFQKIPRNFFSSYHLFIIRVDKNIRKILFDALRNKRYYVNVHYIPIYKHPFYKKKFNKKEFPQSEKYYSEAISIPIYPNLKSKDINNVVMIIKKILNNYAKSKKD